MKSLLISSISSHCLRFRSKVFFQCGSLFFVLNSNFKSVFLISGAKTIQIQNFGNNTALVDFGSQDPIAVLSSDLENTMPLNKAVSDEFYSSRYTNLIGGYQVSSVNDFPSMSYRFVKDGKAYSFKTKWEFLHVVGGFNYFYDAKGRKIIKCNFDFLIIDEYYCDSSELNNKVFDNKVVLSERAGEKIGIYDLDSFNLVGSIGDLGLNRKRVTVSSNGDFIYIKYGSQLIRWNGELLEEIFSEKKLLFVEPNDKFIYSSSCITTA